MKHFLSLDSVSAIISAISDISSFQHMGTMSNVGSCGDWEVGTMKKASGFGGDGRRWHLPMELVHLYIPTISCLKLLWSLFDDVDVLGL